MGPGIGHDVGIAESRVDVGAEKGEGEVRDYPRDRKDSELGSHENRIQDIIIEIDGLRAEEEGEEGNECCHESRQLGLIGNVPASFPEMLCGGEEGATEFGASSKIGRYILQMLIRSIDSLDSFEMGR